MLKDGEPRGDSRESTTLGGWCEGVSYSDGVAVGPSCTAHGCDGVRGMWHAELVGLPCTKRCLDGRAEGVRASDAYVGGVSGAPEVSENSRIGENDSLNRVARSWVCRARLLHRIVETPMIRRVTTTPPTAPPIVISARLLSGIVVWVTEV